MERILQWAAVYLPPRFDLGHVTMLCHTSIQTPIPLTSGFLKASILQYSAEFENQELEFLGSSSVKFFLATIWGSLQMPSPSLRVCWARIHAFIEHLLSTMRLCFLWVESSGRFPLLKRFKARKIQTKEPRVFSMRPSAGGEDLAVPPPPRPDHLEVTIRRWLVLDLLSNKRLGRNEASGEGSIFPDSRVPPKLSLWVLYPALRAQGFIGSSKLLFRVHCNCMW